MKLNRTYLWYSTILMFPSVHEWGHVFIAWLIGEDVYSMNMLSVDIINVNPVWDWLHDVWQYSVFFSLFCVLLWLGLVVREVHAQRKERFGKELVV